MLVTSHGPGLRALVAHVVVLVCLTASVSGQATVNTTVATETRPKKVLTLHLVRTDATGYDGIFRDVIGRGLKGRLDYYSEFIALNRLEEPNYRAALGSYLRTRYEGEGLDLVIASSSAVLEFLNHEPSLFQGVPIVYATRPGVTGGTNSAGVISQMDFTGTLTAALAAFPDLKHVFVVCGIAPLDRTYGALFRTQRASFEGRLEFHDLEGLPPHELEERLSQLPAQSIVFYLSVSSDSTGDAFLPFDQVAPIAAAANAPVFGWHENAFGRGIVGGLLRSSTTDAKETAQVALRVLRGEPAATIPVVRLAPGTYQFDSRQLRRWNIDEAKLPAGSTVSFRSPPFLTQYWGYAVGGGFIIGAQLLLIGTLLVQRTRRRRAEDSQRQAEERNRAILQAVPDLMFVFDRDGRYLDFSASDDRLLLVPPDQFLGRTVKDVMPAALVESVMTAIEQALTRNEPITIQYELPIDGVRYFEARLVPAGHGNVLSIVRDVTEAQRSLDLNRVLARRLITSQEEERQRIARELHDDVSQKIAMINIDVARMAKDVPTAAHRSRLEDLSSQVEGVAHDLYHLSHQLHPSRLRTLGVVASAQLLCGDITRSRDILIKFTHAGVPADLDPRVALCLYRVLQEAMSNVIKHSHSRDARVRLQSEGGSVWLEVQDSGVGMGAGRTAGGLGLVSMRERAAILGGHITIETPQGGGTRVRVSVPLTPPAHSADA